MANTAPVLISSLIRTNTIYEDTNTSVPFSFFNYGVNGAFSIIPGASDIETTDPLLIGIAITGVTGVTGGTVEYSTDNGASWKTAGTAPAGQAIVFKGDSLLRYTPPADANGARTITFHAWDGTGGFNSGDFVNIAAVGTGGSSPFSTATATHTLNIAPDDGKVITNFDNNVYANAVAIVDTNKILVAGGGFGFTDSIEFARYTSTGALDTTFGGDGKVSLNLGDIGNNFFYLDSFTLSATGKYIVSGSFINQNNFSVSNLVAQINDNGTFDTSFGGGDGWVITSLPDNGFQDPSSGLGLALQGTNILSTTELLNANLQDYEYGIISYTSSGILDTSFGGGDGIASQGFGAGQSGYIEKVLVQSDNKILAIGSVLDTVGTDTSAKTTIVRFNADGTLDTSYSIRDADGNGISSLNLGMGNDSFVSATLIANNALLVAGSSVTFGFDPITGFPLATPGDFILAKVTNTGVLDTTFGGGDGIVTTDFGGSDEASVVKVLGDGSILVAGTYYGPLPQESQNGQYLVAKYTSSGALDTTFGNGGKSIIYSPGDAEITDILFQADGKIVLIGSTLIGINTAVMSSTLDEYFLTVRLNANGTLDNTFVGQNNAPVLNEFLSRGSAIFEGDSTPEISWSYFNQGSADMLGFIDGAYDPDGKTSSQLGIAVTGVSGITGGTVQYSIDNGTTWITDANVLAAGEASIFSGTTLLRYTPPAGAVGTRTITFHTWDGTGGFSSGQKVNLNNIGTGGTSPFSANTATHTLNVIGATLGTESANTLNATPAPFGLGGYIKGLGGNDTITGSSLADKLDGGADNDTIIGNEGNDTLIGGEGLDSLVGGDGNDTYHVSGLGAPDSVNENANGGTDIVIASRDFTLSANVENLTLTGPDNLQGRGNTLDNIITGNNGFNTLDGFAGNDTLIGGIQNDTLRGQEDNDYLSGNAGNDLLEGGAGEDDLEGGAGEDDLDGGLGADTMQGGDGQDVYVVDNVGDVVTETNTSTALSETDRVESTISYTLGANIEQLTLLGTTAINAIGNGLNNLLVGNNGNNTIIGGLGNDTMQGGVGNDIYEVKEAGDVVTESLNAGVDTVIAHLSYTLTDNVERLALGGTGNFNAIGNGLNNLLVGNNGNNTIIGGLGNDTMQGGVGNDIYEVKEAGDVVTEGLNAGVDTVIAHLSYTLTDNVERLALGGTGNFNAIGNGLNNLLVGNNGNNTIIGGLGNDTMQGGVGNDIYEVKEAGDVVTESLNAGVDTVIAHLSYTLTDNVERLALGGTGNFNAIGNGLNNLLVGNNGNNTIIGGLGNDTMQGGVGNDIYEVKEAGDVVTENLNAGVDTVVAHLSYTLTDNVERLALAGTGNFNAIGNGLNNLLVGNSGNNNLVGSLGTDTLTGGLGADTFDFNAITESLVGASRDVITDFSVAQGDLIDLSTIDANTTVANDQAFLAAILSAGDFNQIGQLRLVNGVLSGNTDSNFLTSEFEIQLTGVTTLTSAAFVL